MQRQKSEISMCCCQLALHGDSSPCRAHRICTLFLMGQKKIMFWPKFLPMPVFTVAGEEGSELLVRFMLKIHKHERGEEMEGAQWWWQVMFRRGLSFQKILLAETWILACDLQDWQNIHMSFTVFSIWTCSCLWPRIFQLWAKFFLAHSGFWHL